MKHEKNPALSGVAGAIGGGDIQFVCAPKFTNVSLPDSVPLKEDTLDVALRNTGRLPDFRVFRG